MSSEKRVQTCESRIASMNKLIELSMTPSCNEFSQQNTYTQNTGYGVSVSK